MYLNGNFIVESQEYCNDSDKDGKEIDKSLLVVGQPISETKTSTVDIKYNVFGLKLHI